MNSSTLISHPASATTSIISAGLPETNLKLFSGRFKRQLTPKAFAVLTTILIFIIDLLIPPHTAVGVLYLASMSLVFNQDKKTILLFASASSFLILLEMLIFYHEDLHYSVFSDRIISILAVWISCFVLLKYRVLNEKTIKQSKAHYKAMKEIAFLTSHKVRRPVCTLQGLMQILDSNMSREDISKIAGYMKVSVADLDEFTRELNGFLDKEKQE